LKIIEIIYECKYGYSEEAFSVERGWQRRHI